MFRSSAPSILKVRPILFFQEDIKLLAKEILAFHNKSNPLTNIFIHAWSTFVTQLHKNPASLFTYNWCDSEISVFVVSLKKIKILFNSKQFWLALHVSGFQQVSS